MTRDEANAYDGSSFKVTIMTAQTKTDLRSYGVDKTRIQQIVAEQNLRTHFIPDPTATAQRGREKMIVAGVRPEDNIGSCGIIAAREEA